MLLKWMMALGLSMVFLLGNTVALDAVSVQTKPQTGTVTLTFDDGPSPIYTPQVLSILKKYHIHAVFFVMAGLAKQYPDVLKQIVDSGNVVASHTIWHPMLTKLSEDKLQYEVKHSKEIILAILGKPPLCLRPPFFATNKNVANVIKENGMIQIMGYMTDDYKSMGVQPLINHVLTNVRPGMILVFHDGSTGRAQTVAALPAIIEGIQKKGLGFSMICS